MVKEMPTTAWTEIQIDNDSISLTLLTEGDDGARVEDTARFTFEELQEKSGDIESLRVSDETREALSDVWSSSLGKIDWKDDRSMSRPTREDTGRSAKLAGENWAEGIDAGDPMVDVNPPSWSDDARVIVTEVTDQPADLCYLNEHTSVTVADKNHGDWSKDPVVKAKYVGGNGKEYKFPARRLRKPFDEDYPFPQPTRNDV